MARSTEFVKTMRSQLHKWGFAPMTSVEEDTMVQRAREDGASPAAAAEAVANSRIDRFNARKRS